MEQKSKSSAWLRQAENNLLWGEDGLKLGYFAQTCFISQQVAEKALKALAYSRGVTQIKSHSVKKIANELNINGDVSDAASVLDLYYTSGRYPDVLPDNNAPFEYFSQSQAEGAIKLAKLIISKVKRELVI